ncbi:MAG: permease-like cell division protein FtsX [Flavobacteriales bacterium]|nr:permease-like cell division protein FtsX [Flavobacteriales bacterium]
MRHILTLFILILSSCSMNNNSNIDNIKKVLYTQQDCWNNGDIDRLMQGYWNSEKLIFATDKGETTFGWKNTLNRYKSSYPTKESMGELKFEIYDVKLTSKKTSVVNGKWEIIRSKDLSQLTNKITDQIKEEGILFTIILNDENDNNQREKFKSCLDSSRYFSNIKFIDKEISYKELQEDMGENLSSVLDINPLPDSYDAHVKAEFLDTTGLKKIEDFIENYKGEGVVQSIFYQRNMVERIKKNTKLINPQGNFWLELEKFENNWLIVKDSTTSF